MKKTIELLAPAGSEESLRAALAGGADAVYFGSTAFSNRMRARNFEGDALTDAIRLCHEAGAKAHITVNTRIRDREMTDVLRLCDRILGGASPDDRADAVICADFGVARAIKARYPHAVLHASTQTSLSSPEDCKVLRGLGFSRLVTPRELSVGEITRLCETGADHGLEIEIFLHGAHCVSLSGQCLLSYVMGGRSGNRGECAQPCRLPFRIDSASSDSPRSDTPLSLADLCLAGQIPVLLQTGAASLKLEGRLKPAPYVYGVTSLYRRLLDEGRAADPGELRVLEDLFTRGFTDGYFTGKYGGMSGKPVSERKSADPAGEITRKLKLRLRNHALSAEGESAIPLRAEFTMRRGEPMRLTLTDGSHTATAEGEIPQPAHGAPLDEAAVGKNLSKFGGTGCTLLPGGLSIWMDEGLWVPVSALNRLRRAAADEMRALLGSAKANPPEAVPVIPAEEAGESAEATKAEAPVRDRPLGKQFRTAELADASLLLAFTPEEAAEFLSYFRRVYVPWNRVSEAIELAQRAELAGAVPEIGGVLPPLTPDDEAVGEMLGFLLKAGASRVLCHTPGQLSLARKAGLPGDVSFRANITNTAALEAWRDLGLAATIQLSPELPEGALRAIGDHALPGAFRNPAGAIVYGKIPVMALSRCVICGGRCVKGNRGGRWANASSHDCRAVLIDRKGEKFPIFSLSDCETLICNSLPIWMGDRLPLLRSLSFLHFFFTDETPAAALRVLRAYSEGLPGVGRRL